MIHAGLLGYLVENDSTFPDNLQLLIEGGHITKDFLIFKNRKLHYIKGLTPADANKIILYTSPDKSGRAIYVRVDGSARAVQQIELQELLANQ